METFKSFEHDLYDLNAQSFNDIAYRIFRYQAKENKVYQQYLRYRDVNPALISSLEDIPFLPISIYKQHEVVTGNWEPEKTFTSSGTSGTDRSHNNIYSLSVFKTIAKSLFEDAFGPVANCHILALLPSYLERDDSSLVSMVDHLIKESGSEHSAFYLSNVDELISKISNLKDTRKKIIVWGVTYALLDLATQFSFDASHCLIIETGGMKGRRKEMVREEVHEILRKRLGVIAVYSEYGMTELMSMAYTEKGGFFKCPTSMKVFIRDLNDPFNLLPNMKTGGINVIDLANYATCSFIETQDLGRIGQNGYFEVLGRIDNSDIRGCNLMVG